MKLHIARSILAAIFVIIAMGLAPPGGKAFAADIIVKIDNFTFNPETLTVPVGAVVTFVNNDDIPHVVVEKDNKFRSPALDTGEKYTHTFTAAGVVEYYCAIHPKMVGKIIVK